MENINLKKPVYDFFNAHRSLESGETITHLSYGSFRGKFNLNKEEEKQFLKLYIKALDNGVNDFSILEKPTKYSPIIIDIDLKINKSEYKGCKLYTNKLINKIIKTYYSIFEQMFKYYDEPCFVFEKDEEVYNEEKEIYKDGIHIIFPDIVCEPKIRDKIREIAIAIFEEKQYFKKYIGGINNIIDNMNGKSWFMYKSTKPNQKQYKLTKYFDYKNKELIERNPINPNEINSDIHGNIDENNEDFNGYKIIDRNDLCVIKFSVRKQNKSKSKLTNEYKLICCNNNTEQPNEICETEPKEPKKLNGGEQIDQNLLNESVYNILSHLDVSRFSDYNNWLNLYFIFINEELDMNIFYEFSKKSSKYNEHNNNTILKNIKCKPGLTIKTLYYWLKQDNLEEFNKIIKSKSDFFDDSLINNKDIAQLYYNMNPDQFLFNNKLGWYVYNEFNILIEYGRDPPSILLNDVATKIHDWLNN